MCNPATINIIPWFTKSRNNKSSNQQQIPTSSNHNLYTNNGYRPLAKISAKAVIFAKSNNLTPSILCQDLQPKQIQAEKPQPKQIQAEKPINGFKLLANTINNKYQALKTNKKFPMVATAVSILILVTLSIISSELLLITLPIFTVLYFCVVTHNRYYPKFKTLINNSKHITKILKPLYLLMLIAVVISSVLLPALPITAIFASSSSLLKLLDTAKYLNLSNKNIFKASLLIITTAIAGSILPYFLPAVSILGFSLASILPTTTIIISTGITLYFRLLRKPSTNNKIEANAIKQKNQWYKFLSIAVMFLMAILIKKDDHELTFTKIETNSIKTVDAVSDNTKRNTKIIASIIMLTGVSVLWFCLSFSVALLPILTVTTIILIIDKMWRQSSSATILMRSTAYISLTTLLFTMLLTGIMSTITCSVIIMILLMAVKFYSELNRSIINKIEQQNTKTNVAAN